MEEPDLGRQSLPVEELKNPYQSCYDVGGFWSEKNGCPMKPPSTYMECMVNSGYWTEGLGCQPLSPIAKLDNCRAGGGSWEATRGVCNCPDNYLLQWDQVYCAEHDYPLQQELGFEVSVPGIQMTFDLPTRFFNLLLSLFAGQAVN